MTKRPYPSLLSITDEEWGFAEKKAEEKVNALKGKNFTGFIKIDRKNYSNELNNSFRVYVENDKIKHIFATARKKIVEVDRLGEGGFGEVACCKTKDGHIFAAKYQGKALNISLNAEFKILLDREMEYLTAAKEIIAHDYYTSQKNSETRHFAVMKKKEGIDLFAQLYEHELNHNLTQTQKLVLAIKCLQIVEFLHSTGIVHRDLKPENIMVRFGEGNLSNIMIVSAIDFGLAEQLNSEETMRDNVAPRGTDGYAAPEVYQRILTPKNDIYSLGYMFQQNFNMEDSFVVDHMLDNNYETRFTATQCREYFENELKKNLTSKLQKELYEASFDKSSVDQLVNDEFEKLLASDVDLKKKLDSSQHISQIGEKLNKLAKKDAISVLYDQTKTGSWSEFGPLFRNKKRKPQMKAIQHFINTIAGDNRLSPQEKAKFLHEFAVRVQEKISAIHRHSRLARVMKDLAAEIEPLLIDMLPKKAKDDMQEMVVDESETDKLRDYIRDMDKKGLSGYAQAELDALMQLGEKPSKRKTPF